MLDHGLPAVRLRSENKTRANRKKGKDKWTGSPTSLFFFKVRKGIILVRWLKR